MKSLLKPLTDLLYFLVPSRCLVCKRNLASGRLCGRCKPSDFDYYSGCPRCGLRGPEKLCKACEYFPLPFGAIRSLWTYEGKIVNIIRAMKYGPAPCLATHLGSLAAQDLKSLFSRQGWDLIVPVPSTFSSRVIRGFNQCSLIARPISQQLQIPLAPLALRSRAWVSHQARLKVTARFTGLNQTIFSANSKLITDRRVLLIDDVLTSGVTAIQAAAALLAAGASSVDLLTIARAPNWHKHRFRLYQFWLKLGARRGLL